MKFPLTAISSLALLSACATGRPDHLYVLSAQPQDAAVTRTLPATQATLKVWLPSLVDRSEMVINTSADTVIVLDHQRWAAPLTDLVTQALARDLERRRAEMLVADPSANHSNTATIKITVNVVQMTVRRGAQASIDAHWRILDSRAGKEEVGSEVFSSPLGQADYAEIAQALSQCLGLLADRLVAQMH